MCGYRNCTFPNSFEWKTLFSCLSLIWILYFKSLKSHITLLIQLSVLLYLYTLYVIKYSHFKLTPLNSVIYIIVLLLAKAFVRGCYE